MLSLILQEIKDMFTRENFSRIERHVNENTGIPGRWQYFEVKIPEKGRSLDRIPGQTSDTPVDFGFQGHNFEHGMSFTPKNFIFLGNENFQNTVASISLLLNLRLSLYRDIIDGKITPDPGRSWFIGDTFAEFKPDFTQFHFSINPNDPDKMVIVSNNKQADTVFFLAGEYGDANTRRVIEVDPPLIPDEPDLPD